MNSIKKSPLLIIILVIGLISTFFTAYERMSIESENKKVEIILDYDEINKLAKQSDHDLKWWLESFKELGAVSVGLEEETFQRLANENTDVQIDIFRNIKKDLGWKNNFNNDFVEYSEEDIDNFDLIVQTNDASLFEFMTEGLESRYPSNIYKTFVDSDKYIIVIDAGESEALFIQPLNVVDIEGDALGEKNKELYSSLAAKIGLGFRKEKIDLIKNSGLNVIPRPINYAKYPDQLVDAYIKDVEKYDIIPSILIFSGGEILGYNTDNRKLMDFLEKNNISIGLIEASVQRQHIEQDGLVNLTDARNYNAVRIFPMWDYIQIRYKYYNYEGAEEIENTMYRAITERNIRAIYFRPFKENNYKYVTDINEYEKTFSSLDDRLSEHGISLGNFTVMDSFRMSKLRLLLIGAGVVGFGVLLLKLLIPMSRLFENVLLAIGLVGTAGAIKFAPSISEILLSLGASIIFPSISVYYIINQIKGIITNESKDNSLSSILIKGIKVLLVSGAISLLGGIFIGAILSDIRYLLEIDIFRGVKASQLLPILIFAFIYIGIIMSKEDKTISLNSYKREISSILNIDIKVKYVLLSLIALGVGYVYISRTGHETTLEPSDIEMIFRNFLEVELLARPRTKEFLMAFPALMVCIYFAYRKFEKLVFSLALVSSIGFSSIVNTFSHIRTPLYLSIIRTMYALGFGMIIGLIATVILYYFVGIIYPLKGETKHE